MHTLFKMKRKENPLRQLRQNLHHREPFIQEDTRDWKIRFLEMFTKVFGNNI